MTDIETRLKKARTFGLVLCAVIVYLFVGTFLGI